MDLAIAKVDVFHEKSETFGQSKAGAIEQAHHKMLRPLKVSKNGLDLLSGKDNGES